MSSRWSSRVAYKTLPKSKWLLAAFKFTLIYLTKFRKNVHIPLPNQTQALANIPAAGTLL